MKGLLFTYLLTFGGALAAQFRPFVGLLIYIAFALLRPQALWSFSVPFFNYSRVIAIGLLLGWMLHGMGSWQFGRARGMVLAFFGFLGWIALGAPFHPFPEETLSQAEAIAKVFLPFLVGMTLIRSVEQLKQIAWVMVLSQAYLAYEFHLQYYTSPFFIPDEWTFAGLDRNGIAITMCTSVGLALFLGLHSQRWWVKGLAFLSALLMAHVVLFSMSRGGMLGLLVTGLVSFVLIKKRAVHYLMFFAMVAVVLRLAGPQVRERFKTGVSESAIEKDASASSRVAQWKGMIEYMKDEPLFGCGPRQWRSVTYKYTGYQGTDGHSTWLTTGAEYGVPAMIFLIALFALGVIRLWPIAREKVAAADPWQFHLSRMVIASLAGFIVSGQFVTCYGVELPYYILLIAGGVLKIQSLSPQPQPRVVSPLPAMRPAWLAPVRV
jgi:probable O-glycosylation ligase (exosortase A-associated)